MKQSNNKHHHHKDDADLFREQNLRAIRIRKELPKFIFWVLTIVALIVIGAVFAAYYLDN